jgi:hypothetical protein
LSQAPTFKMLRMWLSKWKKRTSVIV